MDNKNLYKILELFEENDSLFLTGGAGVGKSYISKQIITAYEKIDKNVVSLGSTGISAVNVRGFTIHSFFVLGISNDFDELKKYDRNNGRKIRELNKILAKTHLLLIDEISMVSANMMDMILYRLRKGNFRGKILIVGDFFQLPPIFKNQGKTLIENHFAFQSDAWGVLNPKIIELTTPKRTTDIEFTQILHKIRIGSLSDIVFNYLEKLRENEIIGSATYLYGTNALAKDKNIQKLSALKSKEVLIKSKLKMGKSVSPQRAENWLKSLPIEDELLIKEGAEVLFTKNKWGKYFNGERGVVVSIKKDLIVVKKNNLKMVIVEREEFLLTRLETDKDGKFNEVKLASLFQFPLKLSYAITIHKSQGMSIDNLVCNVDRIFSESQFYVAISRATNPQNLQIDFNQYNFRNYLSRVIKVSQKVVDFYIKSDPLFLD